MSPDINSVNVYCID